METVVSKDYLDALINIACETDELIVELKDGVLELTSRSAERGHAREEVPLVEFKGEEVKISLNARYVLDTLSAAESSKTMQMQVARDRRSALFSDESDNVHLISAILTRD